MDVGAGWWLAGWWPPAAPRAVRRRTGEGRARMSHTTYLANPYGFGGSAVACAPAEGD